MFGGRGRKSEQKTRDLRRDLELDDSDDSDRLVALFAYYPIADVGAQPPAVVEIVL